MGRADWLTIDRVHLQVAEVRRGSVFKVLVLTRKEGNRYWEKTVITVTVRNPCMDVGHGERERALNANSERDFGKFWLRSLPGFFPCICQHICYIYVYLYV